MALTITATVSKKVGKPNYGSEGFTLTVQSEVTNLDQVKEESHRLYLLLSDSVNTKPAWQNQHIIFGFAFSLLSLGHLFLVNWQAFLSYLKKKTTQGIERPAELLIIIALSLFVGFGTWFDIQPFSAILEFGKSISNSWAPKEKQASTASVERLNLAELSQQEAPEEHHARFDHDADEEDFDRASASSSSSRELASRDEEPLSREEEIEYSPDRRVNTTAEEPGRAMSDVQAPDDALHRRTTKSCSSCH